MERPSLTSSRESAEKRDESTAESTRRRKGRERSRGGRDRGRRFHRRTSAAPRFARPDKAPRVIASNFTHFYRLSSPAGSFSVPEGLRPGATSPRSPPPPTPPRWELSRAPAIRGRDKSDRIVRADRRSTYIIGDITDAIGANLGGLRGKKRKEKRERGRFARRERDIRNDNDYYNITGDARRIARRAISKALLPPLFLSAVRFPFSLSLSLLLLFSSPFAGAVFARPFALIYAGEREACIRGERCSLKINAASRLMREIALQKSCASLSLLARSIKRAPLRSASRRIYSHEECAFRFFPALEGDDSPICFYCPHRNRFFVPSVYATREMRL